MRIPVFKRHLTIQLQEPDLVFFVSETGHRALSGRLLYLLAPLINGRRSMKEIIRKLQGQASATDVELGILFLHSEGLLNDAASFPASSVDVYRDSWNVDPRDFASAIKNNAVRVVTFGDAQARSFADALAGLGVRVSAKANFAVAITDDYLRNGIEKFNQLALKKKLRWMIVKPTGKTAWIGPVFEPGRTACWECLAQRLRENRPLDMILDAPSLPSLTDAALHLAAVHTLQQIVMRVRSGEPPVLMTLDVQNWEVRKHRVVRLPGCARCNSFRRMERARRILLRSCIKTFASDGGSRSVSAEATFAKYQHHISPITGIVDAVELYAGEKNGLAHSYVAGHLFVPRLEKENLLQNGLKQISAGKGISAQQARTSALCEALERYSGVFRGGEPRVFKTYRELRNKAIHPNSCMNFSEKQFQSRGDSRAAWNQGHSRAPEPLPEDSPIHWTPLWSLTEKKFKYLPTAYCYYGFPEKKELEFCRADSNGNAAGNTLEEAILQGFLELVERDSAALWWYSRAKRPGVDLDSFGNPYFPALRNYYKKLKRDIRVLDITGDFGIPAFAALSANLRSSRTEFLFGCGAHFDPAVALGRALTEMNQFLGRSKKLLRPAAKDLNYLTPDPRIPLRTISDYADCVTTDVREDVGRCVQLAQKLGMETLVLDQTRKEVGLPVVKVVTPGLRQFWRRLAKGRLFETPVKLGWIQQQLKEDELNPDSLVV